MSGGPRVTTGEDSKQDYGTPWDLIGSVEKRFGEVVFDLAAHAGNTKHERYFTPTEFVEVGTFEKLNLTQEDLLSGRLKLLKKDPKKGDIYERRTPNKDAKAYGFDAFAHRWAPLSEKFKQSNGRPGVLWLNCEFADIPPWQEKCGAEGEQGANIVAIMPAMVGANWARDFVFPFGDVYFLNGRVSFDGKNVYPKDCMIAHYHPEVRKRGPMIHVWNWREDTIHRSWRAG